MTDKMSNAAATRVIGSLGFPSKMPGTSYGISATRCITGGKLARQEGTTCSGCYALNGNYQYPSVAKAHEDRLAGMSDERWVAAMTRVLQFAHERGIGRGGRTIAKGWHRWFDSGDLQSVDMLERIIEVCRRTTDIKHWLPTRELGLVKAYVRKHGAASIPDNLTIRVSATMVDGPATRAWPTTSGVCLATTPSPTEECPAPKQDGLCGDCRKCWSRDHAHTVYHKH